MILYLYLGLLWTIIFGIGIFPVRDQFGIQCPGTIGWRIFCTLIHWIIWPISVLQIGGWAYLNRKP